MSGETKTNELKPTIYIQFPNIKGTVTEAKHKEWVELSSLGYNIKRHMHTQTGHVASREMSKPEFSSVAVSKPLDATGALIAQAACSGNAMDKVIIHVCKTGAKGLVNLQEITLKNVYISHFGVDTAGESHRANEHFNLDFSHIEVKGFAYDASGKPKTPTAFGYDLAQATAA